MAENTRLLLIGTDFKGKYFRVTHTWTDGRFSGQCRYYDKILTNRGDFKTTIRWENAIEILSMQPTQAKTFCNVQLLVTELGWVRCRQETRDHIALMTVECRELIAYNSNEQEAMGRWKRWRKRLSFKQWQKQTELLRTILYEAHSDC